MFSLPLFPVCPWPTRAPVGGVPRGESVGPLGWMPSSLWATLIDPCRARGNASQQSQLICAGLWACRAKAVTCPR